MKKKKNLFIIAFLCFITLVGVTIAFFQSSATLENKFESAKYEMITEEEFIPPTNWLPGQTTPKTVITTNEGSIAAMVRVKLEESWTSANNNSLDLTYNNEPIAIINFDNTNDWVYKDGYYYYLDELDPGEGTSSLISGVTFNPNTPSDVSCITVNNVSTCESTGNGYDYATYKLKIITETVQANKYREIWGSGVPVLHYYVGKTPCTYTGEMVVGAEYVDGQYTYRYRQKYDLDQSSWVDIPDDGWSVYLTDRNSSDSVTSTICSSVNNKPIVAVNGMFSQSMTDLIDLSSLDTSNVTSMRGMFYGSQVPSLNLSNFDTSNVIYMDGMFAASQAITIDVSSFDTSNVTDMYGMFATSKVTTLDLSNFDTSKVTDMTGMFEFSEATTLDLSSFDTSNVTTMLTMFKDSKATSINLSSFDTSKVTDMWGMFYGCKATTLDLSSFDMSGVNDTWGMFKNAVTTTGYAKTQADADKLNASNSKPSTLTFIVKNG